MHTKIKAIPVLFGVSLASCFLFALISFGQEMPKLGGVIFSWFFFPRGKTDDKDLATKVMWNYQYRYYADDYIQAPVQALIRKGGEVTWSAVTS